MKIYYSKFSLGYFVFNFCWGKFSRHISKTFHVGVIFQDTTPITLIKSYGLNFGRGNFQEELSVGIRVFFLELSQIY